MFACPICRATLDSPGTCARDGAELEHVEVDFLSPTLRAQFRVERPFARGDTGTLYVARDPSNGKFGLLKILRIRSHASHGARDMLVRALGRQTALASASASLIVPRRTGETDGFMWCFRDFAPGDSLRTLAAAGDLRGLTDALVVIAQVAIALDRLHDRGLVHRAVRPGHVIVAPDGELPRAVLVDAGMVGENTAGSVFEDLGDVFYMSPEQVQGNPVTFRSDLYSLGCLLFEQLTGAPPFDGDTADEVMAAHVHWPPEIPRDTLPAAIADLLASMLSKVAAERPASARAVVRAMEPFLPEGWDAGPRSSPGVSASSPPPMAKAIAPKRPVAIASHAPMPAPAVALSAVPRPAVALANVATARLGEPTPGLGLAAATAVALESAPPPPALHIVEPARMDPPSLKLKLDFDDDAPPVVLKKQKKPSRLFWMTFGFLFGIVAAAGALYGAAKLGYYGYVTDAMTTYLGVSADSLAPRGYRDAPEVHTATEPPSTATPPATTEAAPVETAPTATAPTATAEAAAEPTMEETSAAEPAMEAAPAEAPPAEAAAEPSMEETAMTDAAPMAETATPMEEAPAAEATTMTESRAAARRRARRMRARAVMRTAPAMTSMVSNSGASALDDILL
jgi:serine/threonine protein kinase